jgi:hypothetical protein
MGGNVSGVGHGEELTWNAVVGATGLNTDQSIPRLALAGRYLGVLPRE